MGWQACPEQDAWRSQWSVRNAPSKLDGKRNENGDHQQDQEQRNLGHRLGSRADPVNIDPFLAMSRVIQGVGQRELVMLGVVCVAGHFVVPCCVAGVVEMQSQAARPQKG